MQWPSGSKFQADRTRNRRVDPVANKKSSGKWRPSHRLNSGTVTYQSPTTADVGRKALGIRSNLRQFWQSRGLAPAFPQTASPISTVGNRTIPSPEAVSAPQ